MEIESDSTRIMLIEDEALVALDITSRLNQIGYSIVAVGNSAREAIALSELHRPQLILMDVVLKSGPDGIEAAEFIRDAYDIPCVFITAHTDPKTLERAKRARPLGYILKPFETIELKVALDIALHAARSEAESRQAARALRESEQRYRRIFDTTIEGIWAADRDYRTTYVNQVMADMLGYAPDQIIGRSITDFFWEKDLSDHQARGRRRQRGISEKFERCLRRRDGSPLWTIVSVTALIDEKGRFTGSFAMLTDITGRKRTEDALHESEKLYRLLAENSTDLIITHDVTGRITFASPSIRSVLGYEPVEVMGRPLLDFFHPEDLDRVSAALRTSMNNSRQYAVEFQVRRKDGRYVWLQTTGKAILDADGQPRGLLATSRDVSERKKAEAALRKSHEELEIRVRERTADLTTINAALREIQAQLRATLDALPDIRLETDGQGHIKAFHGSPLASLSRTLGQCLDASLADLLPPPAWAVIRSALQRANENGRDYGATFALERDEEISWFELSIAARDEPPTADNRFVILARDVTARKRAEEDLLHYRDRLRNMATDLSRAEEKERRRLAVDLHDSIGQCLAMSKLKLKTLRPNLAGPDLTKPLDEVLALIDQMSQDARSLIVELSPPILYELGLLAALEWLVEDIGLKSDLLIVLKKTGPPPRLDPEHNVAIFRAVRELLLNVVKHAQATRVLVTAGGHLDHLAVTVQDDGRGFEIQAETKTWAAGDGFGLFYLRERLKSINAELRIHSQPGRGTSVSIQAPYPASDDAAPDI